MSDQREGHAKHALATVLLTSDVATIAVAKSLLEACGIRYFAKDEVLQNVFGLGGIPGVNPIFGSVELQVASEDHDRAVEALSELLHEDGEATEDTDDDS